MNGSCPLTPDEMGLLLSGLGFPISTPVYMASKVATLPCSLRGTKKFPVLIDCGYNWRCPDFVLEEWICREPRMK